MPDRDLETIITEILASSEPIVTSAKRLKAGDRMPVDPRLNFAARRRKPRPPRYPLRTSLRLIVLGLVILLVPLLFAAKKAPPPSITGAVDALAAELIAIVAAAEAPYTTGPLTVVPRDSCIRLYAGRVHARPRRVEPISAVALNMRRNV
jgi:hypothetical protein